MEKLAFFIYFEKSLVFREHGKKDQNINIHTELGYNWRFSELHALLGLQQMKIVNDIIIRTRVTLRFSSSKMKVIYLLVGFISITREK